MYGRGDVAGLDGSVWIINPDLLTARLQSAENLAGQVANLAAVVRIEAWLEASIDVHQTIGVETVLSTPKYRRLVEKAKLHGYEICLVYVFVKSVAIQLERIRLRVAKGGHDVPEAKVRSRRDRSFEQLLWFLGQADRAWIFDNSTSEPKLDVLCDPELGIGRIGLMRQDSALPDGIATEIRQIFERNQNS
jgi:predicted ABC-type ATPase